MEDDTNTDNLKRKSPASTVTSMASSNQNKDTLPDIVLSGKRSDAVTGLLMLGVNPEQLDEEIDNELVMPVNKPKQPDITKTETEKEKNKNKKGRKENKNKTQNELPQRSTRQTCKPNSVQPKNNRVSKFT